MQTIQLPIAGHIAAFAAAGPPDCPGNRRAGG